MKTCILAIAILLAVSVCAWSQASGPDLIDSATWKNMDQGRKLSKVYSLLEGISIAGVWLDATGSHDAADRLKTFPDRYTDLVKIVRYMDEYYLIKVPEGYCFGMNGPNLTNGLLWALWSIRP